MDIKKLTLGGNYLLKKKLPGMGRVPSIFVYVPVRLLDKRTAGKVVVESFKMVPSNVDPMDSGFAFKLANGQVEWKKETTWTEVRAADLTPIA